MNRRDQSKLSELTINVDANTRNNIVTSTEFFTQDIMTGRKNIKFRLGNRPLDLTGAKVLIGFEFIADNRSKIIDSEDGSVSIESAEQGLCRLDLPNWKYDYDGRVLIHTYVKYENGQSFDAGVIVTEFRKSWLDSELGEMDRFYVKRFEDLARELRERAEAIKTEFSDTLNGLEADANSRVDGIATDLKERGQNALNDFQNLLNTGNDFRGPQGEQGSQGETGPQGIQGVQGPIGETGAQGIQGIQGIRGEQGVQGEQGTVGKILGSFDNLSDLQTAHPTGNAGDMYLVDGELFAWLNETWTKIGNIQGPQGVQGYQGPQGEQGERGERGADGAIGPQGPTGPAGTTSWNGIIDRPTFVEDHQDQIPNGSDLNDYIEPGIYRQRQSNQTVDIVNRPAGRSSNAFSLEVVFHGGNGGVHQTYREHSNVRVWTRTRNVNWLPWQEVSMVGHAHNGSEITTGTVPFARMPVGNTATTVARGDHVHAISDVTGLRDELDELDEFRNIVDGEPTSHEILGSATIENTRDGVLIDRMIEGRTLVNLWSDRREDFTVLSTGVTLQGSTVTINSNTGIDIHMGLGPEIFVPGRTYTIAVNIIRNIGGNTIRVADGHAQNIVNNWGLGNASSGFMMGTTTTRNPFPAGSFFRMWVGHRIGEVPTPIDMQFQIAILEGERTEAEMREALEIEPRRLVSVGGEEIIETNLFSNVRGDFTSLNSDVTFLGGSRIRFSRNGTTSTTRVVNLTNHMLEPSETYTIMVGNAELNERITHFQLNRGSIQALGSGTTITFQPDEPVTFTTQANFANVVHFTVGIGVNAMEMPRDATVVFNLAIAKGERSREEMQRRLNLNFGTPITLSGGLDIIAVNENLFDGMFELGGLSDSTGVPTASSTAFRSDFIPVIPSRRLARTRQSSGAINVFEYDVNKNFINRHGTGGVVIQLSERTRFVRVVVGSASNPFNYPDDSVGLSYDHPIDPSTPHQSTSTNVEYNDNGEWKTPTLRSINNGDQVLVADEITETEFIQRVAVVDLSIAGQASSTADTPTRRAFLINATEFGNTGNIWNSIMSNRLPLPASNATPATGGSVRLTNQANGNMLVTLPEGIAAGIVLSQLRQFLIDNDYQFLVPLAEPRRFPIRMGRLESFEPVTNVMVNSGAVQAPFRFRISHSMRDQLRMAKETISWLVEQVKGLLSASEKNMEEL